METFALPDIKKSCRLRFFLRNSETFSMGLYEDFKRRDLCKRQG